MFPILMQKNNVDPRGNLTYLWISMEAMAHLVNDLLHDMKMVGFPVRKLLDCQRVHLTQLGGEASCKDQAKADLTYGGG